MRDDRVDHSGVVTIDAPCRAHLGLISLTNSGNRRYGGAGIALWHRSTRVVARLHPERSTTVRGLDRRRGAVLTGLLIDADLAGVDVVVESSPPPHVGLGSGTAVRLAVLEAAAVVKRRALPPAKLQNLTGRGGASGVGINGYFVGSLIGDWGQPATPGPAFAPSSAARPVRVPTLAFRLEWPEEWSVVLVQPAGGSRISGADEVDFFRRSTPLDRADCAAVSLSLMFELPGAVSDRDFPGVALALAASRANGLKRREIALQRTSAELLECFDGIDGVAATMSSLGPCLVAFCASTQARQMVLTTAAAAGAVAVIGEVCRNGRRIGFYGGSSEQAEEAEPVDWASLFGPCRTS